jgi:hypothetical protein
MSASRGSLEFISFIIFLFLFDIECRLILMDIKELVPLTIQKSLLYIFALNHVFECLVPLVSTDYSTMLPHTSNPAHHASISRRTIPYKQRPTVTIPRA